MTKTWYYNYFFSFRCLLRNQQHHTAKRRVAMSEGSCNVCFSDWIGNPQEVRPPSKTFTSVWMD